MRGTNEHLTVEEIIRTLRARARPGEDGLDPEIEQHLSQCQLCGQVEKEYQGFMSKLYEFGKTWPVSPEGECPQLGVWAELAAGLISPKDGLRYLQHAASCPRCTGDLRDALDALGSNEPAPLELQQSLTTATAEWQKNFARKIASQQTPGQQKTVQFPAVRRWSSLPGLWAGAAAAALAVAAGLWFFSSMRRHTPEALIQEAYARQRTIAMRIPGAGYGPIKVERASQRSQISSPQSLLEAQVLIKRGLEKDPNDADLLRQKAETDLLNWNYQPALDTLNHAARLQPNSFALQVDLATAYFERGEATASPADYEAGLQALDDAVRLDPGNPAAWFNRAIIDERLYFYDRAVADWEQFLKLEKDQGWIDEARQRLQEIRSRLKQRGSKRSPDSLTPVQFQKEIATNRPQGIEEYLELAESRFLPGISAPLALNPNYQAAQTLAEYLRSQHSDRVLSDLLVTAGHPGFHKAAELLGRSADANHSGRFEEGREFAAQAATLFQKSGNKAGNLAAQFEQSYALQLEARAVPCRALASRAAADAHRRQYHLLEVQLLLEEAICSNMSGDVRPAKQTAQRALSIARDHGYQSFYLRALTLLAVLESDAGDDAKAWSDIQEGLGLYWKSDLPEVRAYSFYTVLDRMAERLGHANVQFAAAFEALKFRGQNSDHLVEAAGHARLGYAALRLHELTVAENQFALAMQIFHSLPPTDSVRWRELEARINLARVQSLRGADAGHTAATLSAALPQVQRLSNRYLDFQYYETLAELQIRAGNAMAARQSFENAIALAEAGVTSLTTWRNRLSWMEQHRQPFAMLAGLLLDSGETARALALWEHFRRLSNAPGKADFPGTWPTHAESFLQPAASAYSASHPPVLTYAFGPSGLMIWVRHRQEVHSVQVSVAAQEMRRTAQNFLDECSRPDSELSDLQSDAKTLYAWLIAPVSRWLPATGHLVIEPDGLLGTVPFEALMDTSSDYLGTRYTFTVAYMSREGAPPAAGIAASERALIVAAPTATGAGPAPPPGSLAEAERVAGNFDHAEVLLGREAAVSRVEEDLSGSTIFHFAGHASSGRGGAAMLMADGTLDTEDTTVFNAHRLDKLKLAVFSACATARPSEISEANSLANEFLQAGAQNVVASRWNVDSMATSNFMGLFYDSLISGHGVAQALQSAAGSFRHTRGRTHPYYWAAFAAFGSA